MVTLVWVYKMIGPLYQLSIVIGIWRILDGSRLHSLGHFECENIQINVFVSSWKLIALKNNFDLWFLYFYQSGRSKSWSFCLLICFLSTVFTTKWARFQFNFIATNSACVVGWWAFRRFIRIDLKTFFKTATDRNLNHGFKLYAYSTLNTITVLVFSGTYCNNSSKTASCGKKKKTITDK